VAEKLKDKYFTQSSINTFADTIKKYYPAFDTKQFVNLVIEGGLESKELMAKMRHTTECLRQTLPKSFKKSVGILRKAAPNVKSAEALCLPDFVELYGLNDWDLSLDALAFFTKYSTSEFAIRPFLIKDPKRAMAFVKKLTRDTDPKVRRFASEGCRPRLPWAMALPAFKKDPSLVLPVLELLKNDDSEFVRKSVANNLNDISKDHPSLVLDLCERWFGKSKKTDWIVKHACRSMLKAGDSRAMRLFGFGDPGKIAVERLKLDKKKLHIGEDVRFTFSLHVATKKASQVRLEYAVYFAKAKGKISKKVFKISENTYKPGDHEKSGKHSFADLSTRKHYPGEHKISIIVNGVEKTQAIFTLAE